jgi:replicative DNA helicase
MSIDDVIHLYIKYGEESLAEYPKTGLNWLDNKVRFRPENFSVVNGANSSGKTSLVVQFMENLNKQKQYHILFSLDMAYTSVFEKLGARYTEYTQPEIEAAFNCHTKDEEIIRDVIQAIQRNLPYSYFDFTSSASLAYIEQTVNSMKTAKIDIRMIFVDYAGRIPGEFDSQYANSTRNALLANDIAKRTKTHIMFLSQVSRENGDHTTPLRTSRVSKDSGAWEEGATCVLNIWRPFGNGLQGDDNYYHLYIAKNRSGPLGETVFMWDGKTGTIRPITEMEFEDYRVLCQQNDIPLNFDPFYVPPAPARDTLERLQNLHNAMERTHERAEEIPNPEPSRFRRPVD